MQNYRQFAPEIWTRSLDEFFAILAAWLPRLAGAFVWLIVGWVVARLVQFVLGGLLRRIGFDRLLERAGLVKALDNAGLGSSVSKVLSRLVFWSVMLVFLLAAIESLGLSRVVDTLSGLVSYFPNVVAALIILLFGGLLARLAADAIGGLAAQSSGGTARVLGKLAQYTILTFAIILALQQLQVQSTLLVALVIATVSAIALTLALSFGIGSRELARNIMAGIHAKESFTIGQKLKVKEYTGRLLTIDTVKTVIETESGLISLPNSVLTESDVTIFPDNAES